MQDPAFPDARLLKPFFDDITLRRGLEYARRGLAHVRKVRAKGEIVVIESTCVGSRPKPYAQEIEVALAGERLANVRDSVCSCPMGVDCKHVVAVLATWMTNKSAGSTGETEHAPAPPAGPLSELAARPRPAMRLAAAPSASAVPIDAPRRPAPLLSLELEQWLTELDERERARANESATDTILYALDAAAAKLRVERARRKKDGELAAPKIVDVHSHYFEPNGALPRYVNAIDAQIIQLLRLTDRAVAYDFSNANVLTGALGYAIVERAVQTGRTYAQTPNEALRWGAVRQGRFVWRTGEHGAISITVETDAGAVRCLPTTPFTYFDPATREVGELAFDGATENIQSLLELPPIEPAQQSVFFAHWKRLQAKDPVVLPAPPASVAAEPPATPTIVLRLSTAPFEVYARSRTQRETRPIAEAFVRYSSGIEFELTENVPLVSEWRTSDGRGVLARNVDAERDGVAAVLRTGLRRVDQWGYGTHRVGGRPYWTIGDGTNERWRDSMAGILARADAAGIVLEFEPTFPFHITEADQWDTTLDVAETPGWFDLEIGITIGGEHVPIAKPLATWLSRHADPIAFLTVAEKDRYVLLDLPDGRLVKLPAERVRALLAPLLELGPPQFSANGRLRVSRLEAALHPSLGVAGKRFHDELNALRARLQASTQATEIDPAPGFAATLRPYQRVGLAWLQFLREAKLGGILADDMGLGKTVQALAHLHRDKREGLATRPSLVVSPTSVLPNWRAEAERFASELRVLVLHGKDRATKFAQIPEADIVLTTYALLPRDFDALGKHEFHALILDEGQFLKNPAGRQREVASNLKASHRIVLTGTPVENNLRELWSLFDLALPGLLGAHDRFAQYYRGPIERGQDVGRLDALKRRIRPFLVRRRRAEVLGELPPRTEVVQPVDLEGKQRDLYESLRIAFDSKLRQVIAERGLAQSQIMILDALLKLRQACCDPRLVKSGLAKKAHGESAKLELLREMLEELAQEGRRALVFSQFTEMIALIEAELPALGVRYEKIIGDTPLAEREAAVARFQAGEADVFLISLRAGGTGLNLTAADTVIHYDPWWNPAVEAQATARAHRLGQDKAVFVYKLIATGTVEERILSLLARKQALADSILAGGEAKGALITEEDIQALLAPMV
jgi:superfamily II DNA or RNA helicase